jgi:hypothetical protein
VNVPLTARQEEILEHLTKRRLMTVEQLLYWHSEFGHQSQARNLLQRNLHKLHLYYYIDKANTKVKNWKGERVKTQVIGMGEMGSQWAGWKHHNERIREREGKVILPPTTYHTLSIHEAEIVVNEVLASLDCEMVAWIHECGKTIIGHKNRLNPDAYCLIYDRKTDQHYTFWFEFDTGTDDMGRRNKFPKLENKFRRYKEVANWKEWYKSDYSVVSENKFPYLFFVTEEEKRFPELPKRVKKLGLDGTICMKDKFEEKLIEFVEGMRSENPV